MQVFYTLPVSGFDPTPFTEGIKRRCERAINDAYHLFAPFPLPVHVYEWNANRAIRSNGYGGIIRFVRFCCSIMVEKKGKCWSET